MKTDSMMPTLRLVSLLIMAVLAIILVIQNTQMVATRLLFVTVSMPLAALLALVLLIGIAGGIIAALKVGKRGV